MNKWLLLSALWVTLGQAQPNGYVFDITVQNAQQLEAILERAENLKGQFDPAEHGRIALVLHGRELELFRKNNYQRNMSLVDRARALDEHNMVDIKACQTSLSHFRIERTELPDFIEQVPFAPVEIQRLQIEKGFTRL